MSAGRGNRILFKSFSSGSCGNCYYIGVGREDRISSGVLVDAGVSVRRIRQLLAADHMGTDDFSCVLVTHDHMDHIHSLGGYWKYLRKSIYCAPQLRCSLLRGRYTLEPLHADLRCLGEGWNQVTPDIRVRWFEVPHDATHTVGYALDADGYRIVLITDVGEMTPAAIEEASQADTLVIEANYDEQMLLHGPYPADLKARIRGGHGHLSNSLCAEAVSRVMHDGLTHVFLCHLSENNNTPSLAAGAVEEVLGMFGFKVSYPGSSLYERVQDGRTMMMSPLPRRTPSVLYTLY